MPALELERMAPDPIDEFRGWWEQAAEAVPLAEAMTLATVDADGSPDARMVLLKGFGPDGFRFFTNYESAKGVQLEAHPRAALVIYWRELDRQIRVRGPVDRLSGADSDEYFASRPRDSQIAASVSPQSRPIDREELDRLYEALEERLGGADPERPDQWGGYLVRPSAVEFWQGRESRMHDRFLYTSDAGDGWRIERLAP
ncbi:MAG TPA: pyridoxamine 5'-phosphate oxidase [Solirubrobacterales bacterium]|jgi:pyridoxamine 5'-phosphate oxidase